MNGGCRRGGPAGEREGSARGEVGTLEVMCPEPNRADPETDEIVVVEAPERERFEVRVDGELAGFLDYHVREGVLALVHTEVDDRFGGRGLGGRLARFALDGARERDLAVLPFCSFVGKWIGRHPEYVDLVPADRRAGFGL